MCVCVCQLLFINLEPACFDCEKSSVWDKKTTNFIPWSSPHIIGRMNGIEITNWFFYFKQKEKKIPHVGHGAGSISAASFNYSFPSAHGSLPNINSSPFLFCWYILDILASAFYTLAFSFYIPVLNGHFVRRHKIFLLFLILFISVVVFFYYWNLFSKRIVFLDKFQKDRQTTL